jgi:hypothetical protein
LPQWWESDLEGVYDLSSVGIRFAGTGSYGYEIQVSPDDRITWITVASGQADTAAKPVSVPLPPGTRSSGLRIVLTSVPTVSVPGLAEVSVRGARSK